MKPAATKSIEGDFQDLLVDKDLFGKFENHLNAKKESSELHFYKELTELKQKPPPPKQYSEAVLAIATKYLGFGGNPATVKFDKGVTDDFMSKVKRNQINRKIFDLMYGVIQDRLKIAFASTSQGSRKNFIYRKKSSYRIMQRRPFHELVVHHFNDFEQYVLENAPTEEYWQRGKKLRFYRDVTDYQDRAKKAFKLLEQLTFKIGSEYIGLTTMDKCALTGELPNIDKLVDSIRQQVADRNPTVSMFNELWLEVQNVLERGFVGFVIQILQNKKLKNKRLKKAKWTGLKFTDVFFDSELYVEFESYLVASSSAAVKNLEFYKAVIDMQAQYQQMQNLAVAWGRKIAANYLGITSARGTSSITFVFSWDIASLPSIGRPAEPSIDFTAQDVKDQLIEFSNQIDLQLYKSDATFIFDHFWKDVEQVYLQHFRADCFFN